MKLAIIKTGGKQYKVTPGQTLKVEKLVAPENGNKIAFNEVLLVADDRVEVGMPYLKTSIPATLVSNARSKKITVIKFKSKVRYRKKAGHRQAFSLVKIGDF